MPYYKAVIKHVYCTFQEARDYIDTISDTYLGGYETKDKVTGKPTTPHSHWFYLSDTPIATQRSRIRTMTKTTKNLRGYSVKKYKSRDDDPEDLDLPAYTIKDGVILSKGFAPEQIKRYQEHDWQKKKQKKSRTQIQLLEEYLDKDIKENMIQSLEDLIDRVTNYHTERSTLLRENTLVSQIQTIALKYDIGDYRLTFRTRIYSRLT